MYEALYPLLTETNKLQNMAMKKRAMNQSPTEELSGDETVLPLHQKSGSPSSVPMLSGESLSDGESSSETSFWTSNSPHTNKSSSSNDELLPTWSASPQSDGSENLSTPVAKRSSSEAPSLSKIPVLFTIGFCLVGIAAVFCTQTTLNYNTEQVAVLELRKESIEGKLKMYEKDIRVLQREISAMDLMIQKKHDLDSHSYQEQATQQRTFNEISELQTRLQNEAEQASNLKTQVQAVSREDIVAKYGPGVHKVEIELVFPDNTRGPTKFTIELAPDFMMPHSVHTFLEMASYGLLDGCSFILNALHVLKAAPLPYDGSSAAAKAKDFSDKGLESVAFKEYNPHYPHMQYTVGFAADGSPSFYINTEDNSEIHVGDPCFGKVVEGFDTVKRLEDNPTRNGIWYEHRIGIKKARIIQ